MRLKTLGLALIVIAFTTGCQQTESADSQSRKGMTKVTIMYPNGEGNTFDMDYYANKHMPMVADLLGESMKFFEIDKGISGRTPDEATPHMAIGYLFFDKLSDYENSFGPNAEKIVSDIPNYTNVEPVLQISEVIK